MGFVLAEEREEEGADGLSARASWLSLLKKQGERAKSSWFSEGAQPDQRSEALDA